MLKTKAQEQSYMNYEPMRLSALQERRLARSERGNKLLTVLAVGVLAVTGAVEGYQHFTQPKTRTITERVQPADYENPSLVVQRAETEHGSDPGEYNVHEEALKLAAKYGQLHTGETVEVSVK